MLKTAAINQLTLLAGLLEQVKDTDYVLPCQTLKNGTIGKHVRHILEFYECLLKQDNYNVVNYDKRKRNLLLENNVKYALDFLQEMTDKLSMTEGNQRLVLDSEYGGVTTSMESSLFRELTYNIEHTVHHMAIIGMALPMHFPYIQLPETFGYAESTVQYLSKQNSL